MSQGCQMAPDCVRVACDDRASPMAIVDLQLTTYCSELDKPKAAILPLAFGSLTSVATVLTNLPSLLVATPEEFLWRRPKHTCLISTSMEPADNATNKAFPESKASGERASNLQCVAQRVDLCAIF